MDLETSRAAGPHAVLARLAGSWAGRATLLFEPGIVHAEGPVTGRIELLHDGRFAEHRYTTPIGEAESTGRALIGCELDRRLWQVAWVDSFHTGTSIMLSEGPYDEGREVVDVLGRYHVPDGPPWGWRTTYEPGDGRLVVRHYNVTPDGEAALAVQFDLARA
ncbi:MAG: hypothetical protein AVDCRST_MAG79-2372 [uncultured Thermoleophilia bacterium]|uniref:DUF1579 domain-containing protein n=1 Tax=uncultured Thermoleophilia bacterium TaxID=1497501 RepID=A0A6J4UGN8_9ACTN|nr:MAG: hypothetical protein AVDCRST_MAG79-2372 [uncultured Thermoleophilia bacterium]